MNKKIIRIIGIFIIISPWIYITPALKEAVMIVLGIVLLSSTINLKKKEN